MSANPFITGNSVSWQTNELILSDPQLRKKAGVSTLDTAMLEVTAMRGGGAVNAPFYNPRSKWDGPAGNTPYSTVYPTNTPQDDSLTSLKFAPVQAGGFPQRYFNPKDQSGGFPQRYFNPNAPWN
jgi:hypothetical protein